MLPQDQNNTEPVPDDVLPSQNPDVSSPVETSPQTSYQPQTFSPSAPTVTAVEPTVAPQVIASTPTIAPVQTEPAPTVYPASTSQSASGTISQPSQADTPFVGGVTQPVSGSQLAGQASGKKRKLFVGGLVAALLLMGAGAGAYYGVVVPNQPENVWKTALNRTADGYDKLVVSATEDKKIKGYDIAGNYKLEGSFATDGTIEGYTNGNDLVLKADVGAVTTRINAEVRTIKTPNSLNPDIYVKATGLKGLGDIAGPGSSLESLENQWYVIDHTLLDNLQSGVVEGAKPTDSLTRDDIKQIAQAVGEVNKEYLLTTDANKAVLKVVKNVGKEQQDGRSVYHYEVGLDKAHTKAYLTALTDRLQKTPLTKMLEGKTIKEAINLDSILDQVEKYKESDTADVYVDMDTKLIRTIRLTDRENDKNYLDLGLHYTGGDQLPFVIALHSNEAGQSGELTLKIDTNLKTNVSEMNLKFDQPANGADSPHAKGTAKITIKSNNNPKPVTKPDGAKSLNELMGGFTDSYQADISEDPSNDFTLQQLGDRLNLR